MLEKSARSEEEMARVENSSRAESHRKCFWTLSLLWLHFVARGLRASRCVVGPGVEGRESCRLVGEIGMARRCLGVEVGARAT